MLFRKYDIVVFRGNEGVCKKVRVRGWMVFALFILFVLLLAGNIHYWHYFTSNSHLKTELAKSTKDAEAQDEQLYNLKNRIQGLEEDLKRIRNFDSQLRVMINLDEVVETDTAQGGTKTNEFVDHYLPNHNKDMLRAMNNFLDGLADDAKLVDDRQQELIASLKKNPELSLATPTIWPTEGWVTSPFGNRLSPFTGQREFHQGLDISGKIGTPVYAPAAGTVTFTGIDGGYGKTIVLKHGTGIVTRYCHMHKYSVAKDDTVERGDLIGYLGNSGRTTGPHLHYEVRLNGVCVDPLRYILN